MKLCAWCHHPVDAARPFASRQDGEVWHAECFLKHLAHKDELAGVRRHHPLGVAQTMFCPKCLGPLVRDGRLAQGGDGEPLMQVEQFECTAGCEASPPSRPQASL